jgi:hypothetical protein
MAHMIFDILTTFIDEECGPDGFVDWYSKDCPHKIEVNGRTVHVRDEMQFLYTWWKKFYLEYYPQVENELWELREETFGEFNLESLNNMPDEERDLVRKINKLDFFVHEELDEMLHRIINIRPYMWT